MADYIIKKWLSSLEPLISHYIPPKFFATCKGKLVWSSLKSLSFQVKSYYKALKWGVIVFFSLEKHMDSQSYTNSGIFHLDCCFGEIISRDNMRKLV